MINTFTRPYFFDAGIRFACRRCGTCCTGGPGIVHITPEEIEKIAIHLNQSVQDVTTEFIHSYPKGLAIAENSDGGCRFYSKNGCVIYPVRPMQCRTYPFWFPTLRSESSWENTCLECPGIGNGKRYTREEILGILSVSLTSFADL
ncbi:MAG: YkgJ family cysteine cluster protein [Desulfatirhabdiaceae bacterium]